jgi:hypothetical protein
MTKAVLCPSLKKASLGFEIFANFRPVSNLKFLSKVIMEKFAAARLWDYLFENDLNGIFQSAYKKHHSCETELTPVQNDILTAIDNKQCVALVLLDLSAAFDTVDHEILLHRLQYKFGIKGKAYEWFRSYLTGRTQSVRIDGTDSSVCPLTCGIHRDKFWDPCCFYYILRH